MADFYNKTIIIGRLGCDPELKRGEKLDCARFTVSNASLSDGKETVQFHKVRAYGKQAQLCSEYLHKGDLCCIEGKLDTKACKKDGEMRYSQVVVAERITFLSPKRAQA